MEGQEVTIAVVVIVLLVGALLAWLFIQRNRTKELRDRYGEEYDRTLKAKGGRRNAEADLVEREERVKNLEIRALSPSERDRFAAEWKDTKALFVDSPVEAVSRVSWRRWQPISRSIFRARTRPASARSRTKVR